MSTIKRIFVEKKIQCRIEAKQLYENLKQHLNIENLESVRILHRYDVDHIPDEVYREALYTIFSEPTVDQVYEENLELADGETIFGIEYLPGQYDQRADSCEQCIQILNPEAKPIVRAAKMIVLKGDLTVLEVQRIKEYCLNPVDSREARLSKPKILELEYEIPEDVKIIENFIHMDEGQIDGLWKEMGLAMTPMDLKFTQKYFLEAEKRNPTVTEIRVLDTYWSDHCRHTTFLTKLDRVFFDEGFYNEPVQNIYQEYLRDRKEVFGEKENERDICLMDVALLGMKKLRKEGKLEDLEVSEEINACSIIVPVDVDGRLEEYLIMFKNETHNHPTEIEPFGGAATCLGGAIRDPLSGRSYVYQAMRVTGASDPTASYETTLHGKLPQRKIVTEAAQGYSSYGNQIGLATGQVKEIYHPGYVAKRMEIGAVIAAAPRENVIRETSNPGDVIVLLGGRTGRDGCGGATGSSKEHTQESIQECGAEVQKGNPPTERKIQRLFRNKEVSRLIKKCNDFGAGGVSVAIGELADGLVIDLDRVPKKYAGLDGTELAISESQERMAVVLDEKDVEKFLCYVDEENLEGTVVARVTEEKRLIMKWKNQAIVNISRAFLDTNGANSQADARVLVPEEKSYFKKVVEDAAVHKSLEIKWLENISALNCCSQKGLVERFDASIGASTVLMPFGGRYQETPIEAMVAKIPLENGETKTGTAMSYGFNPFLSSWSPFHGAIYAIVESIAKIVAVGGSYRKIRFTFQEYFKKLYKDPQRWGEPLSALLGAYFAQKRLELPSIGGKDSMSGTFNDLDVPPTLVSFAVDIVDVDHVISPEFKKAGTKVVCIPLKRDGYELPDFDGLKKNYTLIFELIKNKKILSAHSIGIGGLSEAVSKMSFGNRIGIALNQDIKEADLFAVDYGSIVLEIEEGLDIDVLFKDLEYYFVGTTTKDPLISYGNSCLKIEEILKSWEGTLEKVFPTKKEPESSFVEDSLFQTKKMFVRNAQAGKPKVFIPVFPGTNCEYDSKKAFENAGARVETMIFRNLKPEHVSDSIKNMVKHIEQSNIIMLPGGFSAGDEPEGSGKFIATVFRNAQIKEAVSELLEQRDGLMLGICNGFQGLIKLGLLPYGKITELKEDTPTLTYNTIGRHVSCMVRTKIMSDHSPWLSNVKSGDVFTIPVSHGEGRFLADEEVARRLFENGQVATTYVDFEGKPSMDIRFNPNGSTLAIEGILSPDGRVFGKMGHSERIGENVFKNILGEKDQKIFISGVQYFSK